MSDLASIIVAAYSAQSMDSARSEQTRQGLLGPSDLGGCRAYIRHVLTDAPRVERTTPPLEAFIGTWVGEGLEQAYVAARPDSVRQVELSGRLPSGRRPRPGHADLIDPEYGVIDFKGRDGLETVRRDGAPFKNLAQINTYLLFAIQQGLLDADAEWHLVYFDRSGKEKTPHVISGLLDMEIIHEMEQRLDDAQYAALHGEDAPRDEPITFCAQFCEYFEHCRPDANPEGMIDDFDQVAAAEMYLEGKALATKAERMKEEAKGRLRGVQGSTPTAVVRWVHTNETRVEAFTRKPSERLDVRRRRE
jgi:hypothetical protein